MRSRSRTRLFFASAVGSLAAVTAGFALQCAPSEDTSVSVVTTCDPSKLNASDPAEATVKGYLDHYLPALPPDQSDPTPRVHHIAVRRDDEAEMRAEIARLGLPLAFEGSVPGLIFIYLDARATLGHFFEYIWASPEGWEMQGWPKDRPVY